MTMFRRQVLALHPPVEADPKHRWDITVASGSITPSPSTIRSETQKLGGRITAGIGLVLVVVVAGALLVMR